MPPLFHSKSGAMKDDIGDRRRVLRWALPASLVLHALVTALLIFGLPVSLLQPAKEEAVSVTLVPPPKPAAKAKAKPAPAPPAAEPRAEKPKEAKAEKPQQETQDPVQPWPVLKKVFQFGDKDAGPRESADGTGATDNKGDAKSDT